MKKTILSSLTAFLAPLALLAADPFNDAFADKRMDVYLENAGKLYEDASFKEVPGMTGKKCIAFTYDSEVDAEFNTVPVSDSRAYILSFRGQWENSETMDNNPTFEAAVDETWRYALSYMPAMNLVFFDAEEKPLKDDIFMTMPYGKWREYKHIFFPPQGAAYMKLKIKPGKNTGVFYMDNIKFAPIKNSPDEIVLSFGDAAPDSSGFIYGFKVPALLQKGSSGKLMIDPGYGGTSSPVRIGTPGKYRLTFNGELMRSKGMVSVGVVFVDFSGKKIGEASSNKLDSEPMEFTLPKEAMRIKLSVYNHLLEEIKIIRINHE
jgi:hypothetical protein